MPSRSDSLSLPIALSSQMMMLRAWSVPGSGIMC